MCVQVVLRSHEGGALRVFPLESSRRSRVQLLMVTRSVMSCTNDPEGSESDEMIHPLRSRLSSTRCDCLRMRCTTSWAIPIDSLTRLACVVFHRICLVSSGLDDDARGLRTENDPHHLIQTLLQSMRFTNFKPPSSTVDRITSRMNEVAFIGGDVHKARAARGDTPKDAPIRRRIASRA